MPLRAAQKSAMDHAIKGEAGAIAWMTIKATGESNEPQN